MARLSGRIRQFFDHAVATRVKLSALPPDEIRIILCQRLSTGQVSESLLEFIHSRAAGHPYYTEELAKAMTEAGAIVVRSGQAVLAEGESTRDKMEIPISVEGVIHSRLSRLGEEEQSLLHTASLIGRHFSLRILREVHQHPGPGGLSANLSRLEASGLVSREGPDSQDVWLFKHAITRDVVYGAISIERRQQLHRMIAEWYESSDTGVQAGLLAHHWDRAGDEEKALYYLERAGELAAESFSNRDAITFYSRAKEISLERPDLASPRRVATWERQMGQAYAYLADYPNAIPHLRSAITNRRVFWPRNRLQTALDLLSQMAQTLLPRPGTDSPELQSKHRDVAVVWLRYGEIAFFNADLLRLFHSVFRSLNHARTGRASQETAIGYASVGTILGNLRLRWLTRLCFQRSDDIAEHSPGMAHRGFSNLLIGVYLNTIGDWEGVQQRMAVALPLFEKVGDRFRWEMCQGLLGYLHLPRGELDKADEAFQRIHESVQISGTGQLRVWCTAGTAISGALRGRFRQHALLELEDVLGDDSLQTSDRLLGNGALALAHHKRGDVENALRFANRGMELMCQQQPSTQYSLYPAGAVADIFLDQWQRQRSRAERMDLSRSLRRLLRILWRLSFMVPVAQPRYHLVKGTWAALRGDRARAHQQLRRAIQLAERYGMPYETGRAHLMLAQHHPSENGADATTHRERAVSLLTSIGVHPDSELP